MAENDEVLRSHLKAPVWRNAAYLSPYTLIQFIYIIGRDFIQKQILSENKDVKFYSVPADEVSCHNIEQMPLCVHFVDNDYNICEEFLEFLALKRVTGVAIATAILGKLKDAQLPVEDMRGQGYNGANLCPVTE